jgi:hypothetical protein
MKFRAHIRGVGTKTKEADTMNKTDNYRLIVAVLRPLAALVRAFDDYGGSWWPFW